MALGNFIKSVQEADESTKRRWIFIFSGVLMAVVVFVWLSYFNTFSSLGAQTASAGQGTGGQAQQGPSFWSTLSRGASVLYHGTLDRIAGLGAVLKSPQNYNIKP